ncbi:MAG: hypothetical protein F6K47_31850 [Symploca sp. SIO2E6]|nr:hypothetical protein [Symploca sp. SIO2E6]
MTNLFILTVYAIIVALAFTKAIESLETQIVIEGDSDFLDEQLDKQELKELIEIKSKLESSYKIEEFKSLPLSIKNKSEDSSLDIDWDRCSIRDFEGGGRRAIRILDDDQEVPQEQVATIIVPGASSTVKVSDEKLDKPLFEDKKLKKATEKPDYFYLGLSIKVSQPDGNTKTHYLSLRFIPKKLLWKKALSLALEPK